MKDTRKRPALIVGGIIAAASLGTAFTVHASTAAHPGAVPNSCTGECLEDYVSPASTVVHGISTRTTFTIRAANGAIALQVICDYSYAQGKTPAATKGLVPMKVNDPNTPTGAQHGPSGGTGPLFANSSDGQQPCLDSLSSTDYTVTAGTWKLKFVDSKSETENPDSAEPNSGDKLQVSVPQDGATVYNQLGCTIVVGPNGGFKVTGAYDDVNKFTVSGAKIPISITGPPTCPTASTATFDAIYTFSPNLHDAS